MPPAAAYALVALGVYLAMSAVTFTAFALDKHRARRGEWRIPEKTLLILALCCGWPGAMAAMKLVRHKTKTRKFVVGVPVMAGVHLAVWGWVGWMVWGS